jgi:hypothetical protein
MHARRELPRGETRRINTKATADVLERTDEIGWHPGLYFNEAGHALHGQRLGCIVTVMTDPVTAKPTGAIGRTYIDRDMRKVGKAKTLGSPACVVRLSGDLDVLLGLRLAEGTETAGRRCPGRPRCKLGGRDGGGDVARQWRDAGKEARVLLSDALADMNDRLQGEGA